MSKRKSQSERETETQTATCCCPFCLSARVLEKKKEQYDAFFDHLRKARIEVLRAFQSLIDERIASLEQKKKRVTKVKVE